VIVTENGKNFILHVEGARKSEIAPLMAYRGLTFSTSASTREHAVLFTPNPYALADLADPASPTLGAYRRQIDLSRALDGKGTTRLPPGRELWDFQKATLDYLLSRRGGIDGDQPGLGKTPTAIAYCNDREAQRVLVICPASVRIQWGERIKEWSTVPNVKTSVMLRVKDGIHPTAHYQVISYDAARNPAIIRAISKYKWDVLICDEAHKMKNIEALTTRAILGNSRGEYQHGEIKVPAIAKHCREHLALTGTLLLNRPSEAYVLFRFFRLGSD
jgi:SNF2 family DNA or RNA helicase